MEESTSDSQVTGITVTPPEHDPVPAEPMPVAVVTEWPRGTFVENLLPKRDGKILVAIHSAGQIEEVDPATGARRQFCAFPTACAGMVEAGGFYFVNVGTIGKPDAAVYRVAPNGDAEIWVTVPDALFLNGAAVLSPTEILTVDSILGRVYGIDLVQRTARVWMENEAFRKVSAEPYLPGVNGVKVFDGYAYFSNTDHALFCRVPLLPDGSAGSLEVIAERLLADDFAFDVAGNCYLTTHIYSSLLRRTPEGARTDIATGEQFMAGSTAAAFGRGSDTTTLYVTTTGGMLNPYQGQVATAKLLKLEIGIAGAPITRDMPTPT